MPPWNGGDSPLKTIPLKIAWAYRPYVASGTKIQNPIETFSYKKYTFVPFVFTLPFPV